MSNASRSRGNRYAVSALKNKRATLASEIISLEYQIRARKKAMEHVDQCLKLLDPDIEIGRIRPKRAPKNITLFRQGELGRTIVNALREAGGPIGTQDIVTAVLAATGHDEGARKMMAQRVRSNLAYLERRGKVGKTGHARDARWALA